MTKVGLLLGLLLLLPLQAEAASNEAKKPQDGGSRVGRVFPQEGFQHLPNETFDNGAVHAIPNLYKDPRSDRAHDVLLPDNDNPLP